MHRQGAWDRLQMPCTRAGVCQSTYPLKALTGGSYTQTQIISWELLILPEPSEKHVWQWNAHHKSQKMRTERHAYSRFPGSTTRSRLRAHHSPLHTHTVLRDSMYDDDIFAPKDKRPREISRPIPVPPPVMKMA